MTARKPPARSPKPTTAGNHFVANYPPFSCWSADQVSTVHERLAGPPAPDTDLGLYVHIPFCRKRCHFCYFRVYTDRNAAQIGTYVDAVVRELQLYAQTPCIAGRRPRFVYFGGGTPSYLSVAQLGTLTEGLQRSLSWDGTEEITFECEPGTLNRAKLESLKTMGVTRLSLGIENFDDHILEQNNRAHLSKQVFSAYDDARAVEFDQINVDLIAGMIGETDANWQACVDRTIRMAPDSVTIYQMEIPYNTTIYAQMRDGGKTTAPVADWQTKRRWVDEAFGRLEAAGYSVESAYTAVRDGGAGFLYRDALWTGADMLGVGVASFSHLDGIHFQNEHDSGPYEQRVQAGEKPIHRALRMTDAERLIRQFILQLKLGRVGEAFFREKFGLDVTERFAEPLARLRHEGFVEPDGPPLTLTREGLLRVDTLLPEFFLPEHREARYA